jgi:SRSO17 transposase
MPALDEFLRPFHVHFARSEATHALERYLTGLLTEHPNKNCDTIAQVVPDTSEQSLQGLLTAMLWDEDDLNDQRVKAMLALPTEGDAALIFDDTGFAKQGKSSVGAKRQYSGTLGKVGNCQVTVNCHYAERTLAWPVATRLYLPREWALDPARRQKAKVPQDVEFRTKPEIALALLDRAKELGVRHACVTADADYGDNPNFLAGLEYRRERYVVAVRGDFTVAPGQFTAPQRADALMAAQARRRWRTVRWRQGSNGWLRAGVLAIRCWRVTADGKRRVGWLIGEDAGDGKRRYYWSNFGPHVAAGRMVEYAHRRHWVERFHEEAKGLLGWDQYQGRLWPGFHRNSVLVMLAYSFLVMREWRQRQQASPRGRPRGPFSPSGRPPARASAGGASPHLRLAPAAGTTRTE